MAGNHIQQTPGLGGTEVFIEVDLEDPFIAPIPASVFLFGSDDDAQESFTTQQFFNQVLRSAKREVGFMHDRLSR